MLQLRPATAADYAYTKTVKHAAYRPMVVAQFGPWNEAVQDGFFDKSWNEGNYSIILDDGEPCGFCRIDEHDRTLQLVEFAIDVAKQNRGIGSRVLSRFLEMARAKGKLAQLNVMKTNTRAKSLYERLGFAVYAENDIQFKLRHAESAVVEQASIRLNAALAAGTNPDPAQVGTLLAELHSTVAQARSQALHTLSKIRNASTWHAITSSLLRDPDDEVARSAWRAAVCSPWVRRQSSLC